jgi:hypothetical protein
MASNDELKGLWQAIGVIGAACVVCFVLLGNLAMHQQALLMSGIMLAYAIYAFPGKRTQATNYAPTVAPMPVYQPQAPTPAPSYVAPQQPASVAPKVAAQGTDEMKFINRILAGKAMTSREFMFQAVSASTTPDYIIYNLESPTGTPTTAIKAFCGQLAADIYRQRGGGEPVAVTLNEQPLYLRVSTAQRSALPWSSRAKSAPAHVAQLGVIFDGTKSRYLINNMLDPNSWFLSVFSSSGGGKSSLLKAAVLSLMEQLDPATAEFYFIDLDSNQFDSWKRAPHVRFVAETHDQALSIVQHLVTIVKGNRGMTNKIHRYLVIDELQILTTRSEHGEQFIDLLGTLAAQSRKHGFSLMFSTQDPTGDRFPVELQRNVAAVVAGKTKDDSYLKRFLNVDGAAQLRGKGDLIYSASEGQYNFKGYMLTAQDIAATIDAICARWGEDSSTIPFVDESPVDRQASVGSTEPQPLVLSKPVAKPSGVAADAEKLLPYLADALGDNGKLKHGAGGPLLEVLYGEAVPNAGAFSRRLKDAVEYAVNNFEIE